MATSTATRNELNLSSRNRAVASDDHGSAAPVLDGRNAAAARLARLTGRVHPHARSWSASSLPTQPSPGSRSCWASSLPGC